MAGLRATYKKLKLCAYHISSEILLLIKRLTHAKGVVLIRIINRRGERILTTLIQSITAKIVDEQREFNASTCY